MSRVEQLNRILRSLQTASPDVEASALISEDGLMIASALPQHIEESRVAGMTATILSLGTRAAVELERGEVEEVLVRGGDGYAVMLASGSGTLLLALATRNAKLGLIFLDMRRTVAEIKKIL
jgi:predicted regulator of Ras-like GTPase activity (Roadblock/LC7/MglB family)